MGATEPEAATPKKQKYRVTGSSKVFDVAPGDTFERIIPPEQEARLIAAGSISKSTAKSVDAKSSDQTPPSESANKTKEK